MKYTVLRIDEDIDFGCEEHAADAPVMAVVTLRDENGLEIVLRQPEKTDHRISCLWSNGRFYLWFCRRRRRHDDAFDSDQCTWL